MRALVLLPLALCLVQCREAPPRRSGAAPDRLVDVGGHRLNLVCDGDASPTVILDAGDGDDSRTWQLTQPGIASFTRACAYDRAGLGASEESPEPQTSLQIARELHALLRNGAVPPPYVLVGHSFGGLNVRMYASEHPEHVAGIVLVDAAHEEQFARERGLARLGLRIPAPAPEVLESLNQVRTQGKTLGDRPVVVVTRDRSTRLRQAFGATDAQIREVDAMWRELQRDLLKLSTSSTWVVARRSDHYIQLDEPQVVIDAVRSVVDQARRRSRSASPPATTR